MSTSRGAPEVAVRHVDGTAALDKALDVLDAVGSATHGLAQAELAERLGLPRTTLYRLLEALCTRGLLRRDPVRHVYALGARCFEYARSAYAMPDLVAAASAELRALRDMTGETTYLAAIDGLEVCRWSAATARTASARTPRSASASRCTARARARPSSPR